MASLEGGANVLLLQTCRFCNVEAANPTLEAVQVVGHLHAFAITGTTVGNLDVCHAVMLQLSDVR